MPKLNTSATISELVNNQKLFELSPEAIILIDKKGLIIDANQRLKEWLDYSPESIIGTNVASLPFLSKKSKIFAASQLAKRMAGKKIVPYELEFLTKNGTKIIGLINAAPIQNDKGKIIADLIMISDVTERKRAETKLMINAQELRKLNNLMLGREYKMAELKKSLKRKQGQEKNTPASQRSLKFKKLINPLSSSFNPAKTIINYLLENPFARIITAIIAGTYVSLIIILFLTTSLNLAIIITFFVTFLVLIMMWTSISQKADPHSKAAETKKAMFSLLEDISEEKAYEEIRGKSILENIGEGIVITNEKGLIKYVNPAFEKFLGCFSKDIENKDFAETIKMFDLQGKEIPVYKRSDSAMITAKNQRMKARVQYRGGKEMTAMLNAAPIRVKGQFRGVVRIIHDVSEDFKLTQQKDDFFSIASHELRTPLTVIAGNINMILQGYGKSKLSKDDKSLLSDAETATDRLISMVNEFLNVSRLDQGRLAANITELDACKLTNDIIKELKPLTKEKNISLEYSCPGSHEKVKGDENLIKEILINLIGNSIKFTKKGKIHVSHEVKNNQLITTITDTGIGIAQDKQGLLFARFQQAMSRTMSREAGGTGLGLYISREFARLMGGDLKLISSQEGKGSSFAFNLPISDGTTKSQKSRIDTVT